MSMKMKMGTILVLLLAITGFAAASSSGNVFMVVDEPLTSSSGGNDVTQYGHFMLPGGKEVTLSRRGEAERNGPCIGMGQPCGALHWCCGDLTCDSVIKGTCQPHGCTPLGGICSYAGRTCCAPYRCRTIELGPGLCSPI